MNTLNSQISLSESSGSIHWGHFGIIMAAIVLLAGITWMKKPEIFSLKNSSSAQVAQADVPRYYPYVAPQAEPLVAGASTIERPGIINEDGSVSPVNFGEVLGASTQDVKLSLSSVTVKTIPDSDAAIKMYLEKSKAIQNGPIDNNDFQAALSSGNQLLINQQAQKLVSIRESLVNLSVPFALEKLAKLTIIQYEAAIGVLQNFTNADENPELVGKYLQQFLKSQQDLDAENFAIAQKFNLDPIFLGAVDVNEPGTATP